MANQHHPPESGKRPAVRHVQPRPDCHLCTWVWRPDGFELKYINWTCLHRALAGSSSAPPGGLQAWLGAA